MPLAVSVFAAVRIVPCVGTAVFTVHIATSARRSCSSARYAGYLITELATPGPPAARAGGAGVAAVAAGFHYAPEGRVRDVRSLLETHYLSDAVGGLVWQKLQTSFHATVF